MRIRIFTFLILLFTAFTAFTQRNLRLQMGINLGVSRLDHNIRFESNEGVRNLYEFVANTHPPGEYTFGDFKEDLKLRNSIIRPRMALTLGVTFGDYPFFALGEVGTSSSTYRAPVYALSAGVGKEFAPRWDIWYVSGYAGLKRVFKDKGFGKETIVNSVGDKEQRELMASFFGPIEPLGPQSATLITFRGGFGIYFNEERQTSVGGEFYGELDTTDKLKRLAQMTTIGLQMYIRFHPFKKAKPDIKKI